MAQLPTDGPQRGRHSAHGYQQPYPPYFPPQQPPTPPAPAPKRRRWPWVLFGILGVFVVLGAIGSMAESGSTAGTARPAATPAAGGPNSPAQQQPPAAAAPAEQPAEQPAAASTIGDGLYLVGEQIEPGRYRTSGPDKSDLFPNCYWARLKDDSGEFSAIIANDNLQGPGSVTVKAGEFLELSGGCEWSHSS